MPLDDSAATNARNLLNGIDYAALIGGPLQAAIKAQAMAARSTWEFIKEVGLRTGPDGEKEAVNVSFTYIDNGQMQKLIVPLLVIVPIPLIEVSEVAIDFKASINASASQANEQSESSQMAGELGVSAKAGWGPFSITANFKASYSSKKDSRATQDSRYSVEYTQNVAVKAGQAGVPAGLSTILNILSSSVSSTSPDGKLELTPPSGKVALNDPLTKQQLQARVITPEAVNGKNVDVTITFPSDVAEAFVLGIGESAKPEPIKADGTATVKTRDDGTVLAQIWLNPQKISLLRSKGIVHVGFSAQPTKGVTKVVEVPITIQGVPASPTLAVNPGVVGLKAEKDAEASTTMQVTLVSGAKPKDQEVVLTFPAGMRGGKVTLTANGAALSMDADGVAKPKTNADGVVALVMKVADKTGLEGGKVPVNATTPDGAVSQTLTVNVMP